MSETGRLRRVGALWKPREGAKSLGSGNLTINDLRQRFVVLRNDKKTPGSQQPDYVLMSSDNPEVDSYARDHPGPAATESKSEELFPGDGGPFL